MIQINEYFHGVRETQRLGWSIESPEFIPEDYLTQQFFVVFRTCHSFGDWAIISAMPRLLKEQYPHATVAIPSPTLLRQMYPTGIWTNKHDDFHSNVVEVFANNPHVDGMIDSLHNMPVYHDHFRIYNPANLNIPLTEQMLTFWRFKPEQIVNSAPELYWSAEEKKEGDQVIGHLYGDKPFGFLYIDDSFFEVHDPGRELLDYKRKRIQEKIDEFGDLNWMYYAGKPISETVYRTKSVAVDVRQIDVSKRVQNYIKSKSLVIIGHQGGYGTDCMSRYPKLRCFVLPNAATQINEHFIRSTHYILP